MVSIGKLGPGQARYYLDQAHEPMSAAQAVASGVEDYYLDGAEPPGGWVGGAPAALGLAGRVGPDELLQVLAGRNPTRDVPLRLRGSVPGFDVTFSAPKSASVLFGVGGEGVRAAALAAHEAAVAEAFRYLERNAAVGRRGAGGAETVRGEGLIGAAFLHRTSRAGDPQLHTHVLVANMVRGPDGRWTALDGRALYAHGRTAGYLYQAVLRRELSRSLGVRWRPARKGAAEIEGVPDRVVRAFWRRRTEIEQAMAAAGSVSMNGARVAAFATRKAKDRRVWPEALWTSGACARRFLGSIVAGWPGSSTVVVWSSRMTERGRGSSTSSPGLRA
jgi:conjugative relaxase-like TrwC/TraI family protein